MITSEQILKRMEAGQYPCYLVIYGPSKTGITSHNRCEWGEHIMFTEAEDEFEAADRLEEFWKRYQGQFFDRIVIKCYPKMLKEIEL